MLKEIKEIQERNKKVEKDKAWEMSFTRKALIAIFTYIIISVFFVYIGIKNPYINALVPTIAFVLSTLSMNTIKNIWIKYIYQTKEN